jgi:hypothetical protein
MILGLAYGIRRYIYVRYIVVWPHARRCQYMAGWWRAVFRHLLTALTIFTHRHCISLYIKLKCPSQFTLNLQISHNRVITSKSTQGSKTHKIQILKKKNFLPSTKYIQIYKNPWNPNFWFIY